MLLAEGSGRACPLPIWRLGLLGLAWSASAGCRPQPRPSFLTDISVRCHQSRLQSHLETRLWNDIFVDAQRDLGIPNGTIKATCLIETLPAAFEMDEFLYELRDHAAGLNCGRWGEWWFNFVTNLYVSDAKFQDNPLPCGMDEFLCELRDHTAGLNCRRWGECKGFFGWS